MFGPPITDLVVLLVDSVLLLVIRHIAMGRIKNQEDFSPGGRRFGMVLQIFAAYGQATSSGNTMGTVTTTHREGMGGLWSQMPILWSTPFFWLSDPWHRRMRLLTRGGVLHERHRSRGMAMLYATVGGANLILAIRLGLKALNVTVLGITRMPESALPSAVRPDDPTHASAHVKLDLVESAELDTPPMHSHAAGFPSTGRPDSSGSSSLSSLYTLSPTDWKPTGGSRPCKVP